MTMETLEEDVEYNWSDVDLSPLERKPELHKETRERRRGRDIVIAVDHGPESKYAFDWAIVHLCRLADTLHLVHAVSNLKNEVLYSAAEARIEKLAVEAINVAMVETKARIVEGDAGKAICKEVDRLKPAALVMGTRGRTYLQSVFQGSVSEYCHHNCKATAIIIVPGQCIYD
ncbi:uncharacterized protein C167.05 [Daucus carota subsp. sativus]|uniref:uncharacterized protein C167.05 n=1 Tax=Daucus carota subsp. sativus TaxID=79200 RepID=UPI0007B1BAC1|nr:PREDICTED: uncharacterized protein C167.05-like [Daucus carota subsp. sativus]